MRHAFLRFVCAGALLTTVAPNAVYANDADKLTYFTFSAAVQVPNAMLPAGTYQFRVAEGTGSIMNVRSADGKKMLAQFFTLRDLKRSVAPDDSTIVFHETPKGTPGAIRGFFYANERTGWEFVYPRKQALEIFAQTHQPVLGMTSIEPNSTAPVPERFAPPADRPRV